MLPRFGLFEDCESRPTPVAGNASSGGDNKKDPAERAFASRFSGGASTLSSTEGGTIENHPRDENAIYLEPVAGEEMAEEEDGEEEGEGQVESQFEASREAQRLIVESASSSGGGNGEGKGGATFLPVARPDGYSDAQLGR